VPAPAGWAKFWSPEPGVIVYRYTTVRGQEAKRKAFEKAQQEAPTRTDDLRSTPPVMIDWLDVDIDVGTRPNTGDQVKLPNVAPANDNAPAKEQQAARSAETAKNLGKAAVATGAAVGTGYLIWRAVRCAATCWNPLVWTNALP
jgi:hypothetical protein